MVKLVKGHVGRRDEWRKVHILGHISLSLCDLLHLRSQSMTSQWLSISWSIMTNPYPPAEVLPVLCATFSKIEEKLIKSIITHQLLARDLYKLQLQYTSKEGLREVSLYKNPGAVLHPPSHLLCHLEWISQLFRNYSCFLPIPQPPVGSY